MFYAMRKLEAAQLEGFQQPPVRRVAGLNACACSRWVTRDNAVAEERVLGDLSHLRS